MGYEDPEIGFLSHDQFKSGEKFISKLLGGLGYNFSKEIPGELDTPIVLVQNERTEGERFDFWDDATGERYHYPNKYKNKVRSGRRFVYYKGERRKDGTKKTPEYFGWGIIGEVNPDPETLKVERKVDQRWICQISEYTPFENPVPFKINGNPFESIPQNHWGTGVRTISEEVFESILSHAGAEIPLAVQKQSTLLPPLEEVVGHVSSGGLLKPTKPATKTGSGTSGGTRRSKFSKELGDRGEEIVLEHLRQVLTEKDSATLKWTAQEGEKPGWDIEYKSNGRLIGVEVKATGGSYFPSIELTANEWKAAEQKRSDFRLALVSGVRSKEPQIEIIEDPWGEVESGGFRVEPLSWRFVKRGD